MAHDNYFCCCEYLNEAGERSHILGSCCNCVALDETCDSLLCCRGYPTGSCSRILSTLADRVRIPFCDGKGARRLDMDRLNLLLPLFIPPFILFTWSQGISYVFISSGTGIIPLAVYAASKNTFNLCLSSLVWLLVVMQFVVVPELKVLFMEHCILMTGVSVLCLFGSRLRNRTSCISQCSKRRYHSSWLSCCIERNSLYPVFLMSVFLTSAFYADLTLTSACVPWSPPQPVRDLILLPYDCTYVYEHFRSSVTFASGLYALVISSSAFLSLIWWLLCPQK